MSYISNIIVDFFRAIAQLLGGIGRLIIWLINQVFIEGSASSNASGNVYWAANTEYLKNIMMPGAYDNIILFFKYVGLFAAVVLFAVNFFLMWRSDGNIKDTAFSAIRKFITAIIIVTLSAQIMNFVDTTIMTVEKKFWSLEKTANGDGYKFWDIHGTDSEGRRSMLEEVVNGAFNGAEEVDLTADNVIDTLLGALGVATVAGTFPVAASALAVAAVTYFIIQALLILLIAYHYFKLAVELIRRYVSWCVLHITFPAVSGTLATGYTSEIFWTYLKSYASEGICMFMTYFFMKGTSALLTSLGGGLIQTFVVISWINIGIDLDRFMKDHGFSISAAGGNLAEGMLSSVARMSMAGSMIGGVAGSTLVGAASALGSVPLAQLGNAFKTGDLSVAGGVRSMMDNGVGQILRGSSLGGTEKGVAPHLSSSELGAMKNLFHTGDAKSKGVFSDKFNQLGSADRMAVLNAIKDDMTKNGSGALYDGANALSSKFGADAAGRLKFTGIDGRGNIVGEMQGKLGSSKVTIGSNALNASSEMFESADGKDNYLTMGSTVDRSGVSLDGIKVSELIDGEQMDTDTLANSELGWNSKIDTDDFSKFLGSIDEDRFNPVDDDGNHKYNFQEPSNWSYRVDQDGQECLVYNQDDSISYRTNGKQTTYSFGGKINQNYKKFLDEIYSNSEEK